MLEQDGCLSNICIKTIVLFECVVIISFYCIKVLGNICKLDYILPFLFLLLGLWGCPIEVMYDISSHLPFFLFMHDRNIYLFFPSLIS